MVAIPQQKAMLLSNTFTKDHANAMLEEDKSSSNTITQGLTHNSNQRIRPGQGA